LEILEILTKNIENLGQKTKFLGRIEILTKRLKF